jgi:hypothetical protein
LEALIFVETTISSQASARFWAKLGQYREFWLSLGTIKTLERGRSRN